MVGTDGIWEGRNKAGEMFGKRRLQEIIRRNAASSAETILAAVFRDHTRFSQGTRTEDDITLVIIKFARWMELEIVIRLQCLPWKQGAMTTLSMP